MGSRLGIISALTSATGGAITATQETDISDGESVVIAGITYVWSSAFDEYLHLLYTYQDVTANLQSLTHAINGTGTVGTTYLQTMVDNINSPHPHVSASLSGDVITLTARVSGELGNYLTVTESTTGLSVTSPLAGGIGSPSLAIASIQDFSQINAEVITLLDYMLTGE